MMIGPYELNSIVTGDARELAKGIPDESIDLIFTDPPYPKEYLYIWDSLAKIAEEKLIASGFLMTYCPSAYFEYVFDTIRNRLEFYWIASIHEAGMNLHFHPKHAICGHKNVLLYRKKNSNVLTPRYFPDGLSSTFRDKQYHAWGQNLLPAKLWIDYLSPVGGVVLDPFVGGGTTLAAAKMLGRNYLGFEIDPEVAKRARERVRNTQTPLFVPEPEQLSFSGPEGELNPLLSSLEEHP